MKKIVFVGGSKGLGKKLLQILSKKYDIINLSRSKAGVKNVLDIKCDISSYNSVKNAFSKIKYIDVLINNAGISHYSSNTIKNFDKIVDVNLKGIFYCCQEAISKLKKNKSSSIINISSINAYAAFPNNPGYVSSKAGLISLTRSLALDHGKFGVRVNSISPGYLMEGMAKKSYQDKNERKRRLDRMIIKRFGNHFDIIRVLEFLINETSGYITGQDIIIDGGWLAKGL
jgi:NAD(P)-dependent dehydrogenase (short-subunit alcohol dehydrogenase family)